GMFFSDRKTRTLRGDGAVLVSKIFINKSF
ncbi:MAG: hypothetical protein ACI88A_001638, partial [Paraglaciecola sp.]